MDLNTALALVLLFMLATSVKRTIWGPQRNFARLALAATLLGIAGVLAAYPAKEGFLFNAGALLFLLGIVAAVVSNLVEAIHHFRHGSDSKGT